MKEKDDSLKLKLRKNMRCRQRSKWKRSHEDAVMREFGDPQSPHNFLAAWINHHIHYTLSKLDIPSAVAF